MFRSGSEPIVVASQDTVDSGVMATHRHYGFGQVGSNLDTLYMPVPGMQLSGVQVAYGTPLKIAEGAGLPTIGEQTRVMIFIPEPATMSLLGLGGLVALLRRKR